MLLPSLLKSGDQVYQKVIKQLYQKMLLLNLLITDIETRIEKLSVFDWWGCPIKQYDLGVNIMDIIIDESSKTGYVIYRDDEYEYHLGNFDL